jgi:hypothetical protein
MNRRVFLGAFAAPLLANEINPSNRIENLKWSMALVMQFTEIDHVDLIGDKPHIDLGQMHLNDPVIFCSKICDAQDQLGIKIKINYPNRRYAMIQRGSRGQLIQTLTKVQS